MIDDIEVNIIPQIPHIAQLEKGETFVVNIPVCCREGFDDCEHVPQKQRRSKRNIGL